jgi:hypothetical protein
MAEFGWMENEDFRAEVEARVSRIAGLSGMTHYRQAIVTRLMSHLEEKKGIRLLEESRKASHLQRTKSDALNSVQLLVETAAQYAKADNRKLVTEDDLDKAYEAKFCMVWPFC